MLRIVKNYQLLYFFVFLSLFNQCLANTVEHTGIEDDWQQDWDEPSNTVLDITGFIEAGQGEFVADNVADKKNSLQEVRAHIEASTYLNNVYISFKGDAVVDEVTDDSAWDTREAIFSYTPFDSLDVKFGRQILTWGTGDQVFLNDTFAKDWQSLFSGRDVKYLKVPTNAMRSSYFSETLNADFVWISKYQADKFVRGERFSYYSKKTQEITIDPIALNTPSNDEYALRLYRNVEGYEVAFYGSKGYYKEPVGFDVKSSNLFFPRFGSYGASIRGTVGSGVAYLEFSQYLSLDDKRGTNPLITNSELRFLFGYEQELISKLNIGFQYYLEHLSDYERMLEDFPIDEISPEENRHVITFRLSYRMMQNKLTLSIFTMASPNENDAYLASRIIYRSNDHYNFEIGSRTFLGKEERTFLGQLRENDNVYIRLRYSF
jgi:hypothetical protein